MPPQWWRQGVGLFIIHPTLLVTYKKTFRRSLGPPTLGRRSAMVHASCVQALVGEYTLPHASHSHPSADM